MIKELRAWGEKYNKEGRYTPVGMAFHWVMAALILFQLGWGFWTDLMMPGGDKIRAYEIHSAVGLPILVLAVGRFLWRRLMYPGPINDADVEGWRSAVAHLTAVAFYVLFFTLPISGWVMWSSVASPGPLYLAGVLPWPQVPLHNFDTAARFAILDLAEDAHWYSILALLLLIPAHVGAALMHHFWWRHDVLTAMLPEVPDWEGHRGERTNNGRPRSLRQGTEAG
jgi:cytochrome b561